jgi:hypothetical protein
LLAICGWSVILADSTHSTQTRARRFMVQPRIKLEDCVPNACTIRIAADLVPSVCIFSAPFEAEEMHMPRPADLQPLARDHSKPHTRMRSEPHHHLFFGAIFLAVFGALGHFPARGAGACLNHKGIIGKSNILQKIRRAYSQFKIDNGINGSKRLRLGIRSIVLSLSMSSCGSSGNAGPLLLLV